ncbi:hypothetical protein A2130_00890 [Candidatus Woesebacteria bacterium GWC2_33_12]|uniref:DUF4325 domain-containing protein n=1 Tax=Candidatus Woesebacteria bacterium GW2011_GWB1_33_22 TaxID=1618566 RepID=A0A0F9ZMC2_9BACT|nr:MAG: hypothetical protein UR29_C0002G0069 [Candidatus Woesebacteria bacterium GW2011_GWC2_33_12]KKP42541.1 MAG: hypothetical protein UR33_C0002G0117 [Candidatus Woesebacteria bacterium GW2011_GWA2_33_20]KKP45284.1 MAG: hypothetical protein UR35_C0002G0117 [Candidatus Woesebacteria bacterium GW2011_GWB1_33_22]KKP47112.1 MAG: hypothetical protein UR37_C0002G0024 [Microgenomates group bacterium GW2011_GWC1_33_28]KKP50954.1 MAG: hypothetical protein UR41_C0002G0118 [Candidatus Woesebacteria bact
MVINLNKFGTTLVSRPAGKEASLAFNPTLREVNENEKIEVDFTGVEVLTPSWADEFLTPLYNSFNGRIKLTNTGNSSVIESLKILNFL